MLTIFDDKIYIVPDPPNKEIQVTQPTTDNVYVSITLGNVPRPLAEEIVAEAEELAGDYDISVDYGDPIGDAPTQGQQELPTEPDGSGDVPTTDVPEPAPATSATDAGTDSPPPAEGAPTAPSDSPTEDQKNSAPDAGTFSTASAAAAPGGSDTTDTTTTTSTTVDDGSGVGGASPTVDTTADAGTATPAPADTTTADAGTETSGTAGSVNPQL